MDSGKVQTISGVVTQGAGNNFWGYPYNQYRITSFWVKVSVDGEKWTDVECGKIFEGNTDTTTALQTVFDRPIKARYVRIIPRSWYWGPGLRAALLVCESDCKNKKLDYQLDQTLGSTTGGPSIRPMGGGQVTTDGFSYGKGQGLSLSPSSCIGNGKVYTLLVYAQLKELKDKDVKAVILNENWADGGGYIDKYWRLRPSDIVCESEVIRPGYWYWFGIRRDKDGNVDIFLNGYKCASGKPKTYGGYLLDGEVRLGKGLEDATSSPGIIDRVVVVGEALTDVDIQKITSCSPAAIEAAKCDRKITAGVPYSKFASSTTHVNDKFGVGEHARPRLNSRSAWCAGVGKKDEWLQMDTGKVQAIQGIVTQGRRNADQWVTTFRIMVSEDLNSWRSVECGRIFDGNVDRETKVKTLFNEPVKARYVRVMVETWQNWLCMRAAVILCEEKCQESHLDYDMKGFRSDSGGPELSAPYGEGYFIGKDTAVGYHLPGDDMGYKDMSWDDCQKECSKNSACVAYVTNNNAGRGCWLKNGFSGSMNPNDAFSTVFMTDRRLYKERAKVGYFVVSGQGLQAAPEGCFTNGKEYSIILDATVLSTNGMRRVMSSGGWGDDGLYILKGKFTLYPTGAGLQCEDQIEAGRVYRFGFTRNAEGKVRIYLDGMMCSSAYPTYADGLIIDLTDVSFFVDREAQYQTQAYVRRIQMWNRALSQKEMGQQSNCESPEVAGLCPRNSRYFPPLGDVSYSGFASPNDNTQRSGRALNETNSWVADMQQIKTNSAWMQIDLKARKQVSAVSLKQDEDRPWQVTSMRIMASDDLKTWTYVECGRKFKFEYMKKSSRIVTAELDQPIVARYVHVSVCVCVCSMCMCMCMCVCACVCVYVCVCVCVSCLACAHPIFSCHRAS